MGSTLLLSVILETLQENDQTVANSQKARLILFDLILLDLILLDLIIRVKSFGMDNIYVTD